MDFGTSRVKPFLKLVIFFRQLNVQLPQKKVGSFEPMEKKIGKCI